MATGPLGWFDPELVASAQYDPELSSAGQFDRENVDTPASIFTTAMMAAVLAASLNSTVTPPRLSTTPARFYEIQTSRFPTPWPQLDPKYAVPFADQLRNCSYVMPVRRGDPAGLLQTQPSFSWLTGTFADIAKRWPAIERGADWNYSLPPRASALRVASDKSYLSQTRPSDAPSIWFAATAGPPPPTVAQTAPTFQPVPFQTPARVGDPGRLFQTQPDDCWISRSADSDAARFGAACELATNSFRTPDGALAAAARFYAVQTYRFPTPWPRFDAQYFPPVEVVGKNFRMADRTMAAIQTQPTWTPQPPAGAAFDPALVVPSVTELRSFLSAARSSLYPTSQPSDAGTIYAGASAAIAQSWPAVESGTQRSYRTPDRQTKPIYTQPSDAWIYGPGAATVAVTWPAIEAGTGRNFRTPDRLMAPIPTQPSDAWQYQPGAANVASFWPAVESGLQRSYRAADRQTDRTYILQGQPSQAWLERQEEAVEASTFPAIGALLQTFRSPDRVTDRTFILQGQPVPVFTAATQPFDAFRFVPISDALRAFRTNDAQTDRFYLLLGQPSDAWRQTEEDAAEAQTFAAVSALLGAFRTPDRISDKSYILQGQPAPVYKAQNSLFEVPQYVPSSDLLRSYRAADPVTDRFFVLLGQPSTGWLEPEEEAAEAQFFPAVQALLGSYRMPDRISDRTFILQGQPAQNFKSANTLFDSFLFPAISAQTGTFRTPDKVTDKFFVQLGQPSDAWREQEEDAAEAQTFSAVSALLGSYRMPDRITDRALILQGQPAPVYKAQNTLLEAYQFAPIADALRGFRTTDAATDRFFILLGQPSNAWLEHQEEAVESQFFPAIQSLLGAFRTPDRISDKTFIVQGQPAPNFKAANTLFDPFFYPPITGELAAFRTPDRQTDKFFVLLGQPSDAWREQEEEAAEAQTFPAIAALLGTYRTPDRITDRTYLLQGQPAPVYKAQNPLFEVPQYVPSSDLLRAFRTNDAVTDRFYLLLGQPSTAWTERQEETVEAAYFPAIQALSGAYRTPDRITDKTYILQGQPEPNYKAANTLFDPFLYPPITGSLQSFRAADRVTDRFFVLLGQPSDAWREIEEDQAEAATFAAVHALTRTFRTPDRISDRTLILQGQPAPVYKASVTLFEAYQFQGIGGGRMAERAGERHFSIQTQPQTGWMATPVNAYLAQTYPALELARNFRMADRVTDRTFILQGQPIPVYAAVLGLFNPQYFVPVNSFRMADRAPDRHLALQTQPSFGWIYTPVNADVRRFFPGTRQENFLTPTRNQKVIHSQPSDAWIYRVAALSNQAQVWPAIESGLQRSFRMPDRPGERFFTLLGQPAPNFYIATRPTAAQLWAAIEGTGRNFMTPARDMRYIPTQPSDAWIYAAAARAAAQIPLYVPALSQSLGSYRAADRRTDRFFILQTQPDDGWPKRQIFVVVPVLPEGDEIYYAVRRELRFDADERGLTFTAWQRGIRFDSDERGLMFAALARLMDFDPDEEG